MTKTRLLIAACSALLFASACKKNDAAKPADKAATTAAKPAETKPATPDQAKPADTTAPAAAPAAPAAPAAAPAAAGPVTSADDYQTRGTALLDKMTAIFAADGKDCAKIAADVSKYVDDNKGEIDAVTAYEKAHPADKKAWDQKNKAKTDDFMAKAGPSMEACKDNKALQDAMAKLPE